MVDHSELTAPHSDREDLFSEGTIKEEQLSTGYLIANCKYLHHRLTDQFQTLMGTSGHHNGHFDIKLSRSRMSLYRDLGISSRLAVFSVYTLYIMYNVHVLH